MVGRAGSRPVSRWEPQSFGKSIERPNPLQPIIPTRSTGHKYMGVRFDSDAAVQAASRNHEQFAVHLRQGKCRSAVAAEAAAVSG